MSNENQGGVEIDINGTVRINCHVGKFSFAVLNGRHYMSVRSISLPQSFRNIFKPQEH